jgi:hypothetical protein
MADFSAMLSKILACRIVHEHNVIQDPIIATVPYIICNSLGNEVIIFYLPQKVITFQDDL